MTTSALATGTIVPRTIALPQRSCMPMRGLAELRRVTRHRLVIVTYDLATTGFWLVEDYFPAIKEIDRRIMPSLEDLHQALGPVDVRPLPVPHDCTDGFLGAYWRRPSAYLDPGVRSAISAFAELPNTDAGLGRLRADLADGTWERRYGHLMQQATLDLGYRLVVAHLGGDPWQRCCPKLRRS
jgi:hypothetical protein